MRRLAALAAVLAAAVTASSAAAATPSRVVLPRDHGAHPDASVEWWYTTGRLRTEAGRRYFWFATVWVAGGRAAVARLNVVDLDRDRVVLAKELGTATVPAAGSSDLAVGDLRLRRRPGGALGRYTLEAAPPGGHLRLSLRARVPYVLHGRRGIVQQGPGGPSAYYSEPRLAASGTLRLGGQVARVRGLGWFDHQWGDFARAPGALRWDWFACQLADGRDLMLYQFLDPENRPIARYARGTLAGPGGRVRHLGGFTSTPLGPVVRPAGARASYPLGWRLEVPGAGLALTLRAEARSQFISNRVVPSFWEGAARITRGPAGRCMVEDSREVSG
jgi:predicted secreted hydrolase